MAFLPPQDFSFWSCEPSAVRIPLQLLGEVLLSQHMFWGDRTWIGEQKNQLQVCCSHFHAVAAVSALRALKYSWLGMGLQPLLILEKRSCSLSLAFPENCGLTLLSFVSQQLLHEVQSCGTGSNQSGILFLPGDFSLSWKYPLLPART